MRKVSLSLSLNASVVADQKGGNLEAFHSPGLLKFQGKDWDMSALRGLFIFLSHTEQHAECKVFSFKREWRDGMFTYWNSSRSVKSESNSDLTFVQTHFKTI